jgi:hypothetical protein
VGAGAASVRRGAEKLKVRGGSDGALAAAGAVA